MDTNQDTFASDFLENYLKFGLGSMPKTDIDALVMALIDRYGQGSSGPMASLSNQTVSERLRTPVAKIKKLRYDAALKFGGRVEDQAMGRLLAALAVATLEPQDEKVCLIIEDALAKNWLQGQLKVHQQIFDHPFNTEIIRVSSAGLFSVLETLFNKQQLQAFKKGYEEAKSSKDAAHRIQRFKSLARKFADGAAEAAGAGVVAVVNAHLAQS
jgi:alpha-D-ribose 1-methylphosphonate 5-triphosphate synthase subunit PhnH